ncbi:MEKHLA domain-containing protein [Cyanobium sp. Aljojuca 7D2]|uniref:MEKHLA domain-containing protein n=1 Tax=Cyanobium sp. Aljojuca 7D2 TaxID=2823698 RepID=UPI0020CDBB94|nr:MEKHLA domain-containing protein [Cyanobium sp. Aljojuca 7D2]MCP9890011.1 MEKHLA domain-containing protein [Cyanobium sp. Aljojuca 7D2]
MTPESLESPPWLSPQTQALACLLLSSHQQAFGTPLIAGLAADASSRQAAQELFASEVVVLAHNGADPATDPGPRLIYSNRAALRLWQRPWNAMVGMPSRLTAEPAERASRSQALVAAQAQHALSGYSGIRIDSRGRRFQIDGARLWTLRDEAGLPCGQAARFSRWWHLAGGT